MTTINTYTLQQDNQEIIDYVSDELDGKRVVFQASLHEFKNRAPIWSIDGLIMKDGAIIHDFAPSTQTQYSNKVEARQALEKIVASLEPVQVLKDNV